MTQRCYNGVRYLGSGPSPDNIARLDFGAWPIVAYMRRTGLQVDLDHFARLERTLTDDMERLTEDVRALTGIAVNLDSGDQVSQLLFKQLGLKQVRPKFTQSGDRESVEHEVLLAIQHDHPVVPLILDFKELSKLRGTYVAPMPKLAQRTAFGQWRMFPNLNQTRIPSGRFACKEPNLLAIPGRTARGAEIRKGFITDAGWVYTSCDLSQIEPRVAAHRSQDPALLNVYLHEEDIYSDFAIAAFRLPDTRFRNAKGKWEYPGVHPMEHRRPSKICVLASIYEVSAKGLLEQMPIVCKHCGRETHQHDLLSCPGGKFESLWTEDRCQTLIADFYTKYPGLLRMRKLDHSRARQYGYLWDDFGRLMHSAAVHSVHEWVVSAALREAGNFPIQSTACGILKLAMAEAFDVLEGHGLLDVIHPLLPIHDEIVCECREDVADEWIAMLKDIYARTVRLRVPIKSSGSKAISWGLLEK